MWWLRERIYILVDSRQEFTETTNQSFSWKLFIWVFWKETSVILNDFTITSKSRLLSRLGFSEIELLFKRKFFVCVYQKGQLWLQLFTSTSSFHWERWDAKFVKPYFECLEGSSSYISSQSQHQYLYILT